MWFPFALSKKVRIGCNEFNHLLLLKWEKSWPFREILPPFPKDLPSFRLRVFPKDLPSFALFLIWQNKFPYFMSLSYGPPLHYLFNFTPFLSSTLTSFYLFIYLNPFLFPTLLTPCPTQLDFPWYL